MGSKSIARARVALKNAKNDVIRYEQLTRFEKSPYLLEQLIRARLLVKHIQKQLEGIQGRL